MGMTCELRAVDEGQINEWLANPESKSGFLNEKSTSLEEDEAAGTYIYIDKAWHGIHFLLTGSAWEGEEPWCYLMNGGATFHQGDPDSAPDRVLRPNQIAAWADALGAISTVELRRRFDPEAMMEAGIYPGIWDRDPKDDDTLGYLLEYYETLRSFLEQTKKENKGVIITIS